MQPDYAAAYRELYGRHWWWRAREAFLLARLDERYFEGSRLRILDVGCGDALFFDQLSRYGEVRGIEPDRSLISDGPWRSRIHVGELDATYAAAHSFDWILLLDVLEHVERANAFLEAARQALAPDGTLFITVPAFQRLWTSHDDMNHHFRRYTRAALRRALEAAGFRPLEMRYFYHWIAPLKFLVAMKERVLPAEKILETVPPRPFNALAHTLSRLEQLTWGKARLPFGTSLYACCAPVREEG